MPPRALATEEETHRVALRERAMWRWAWRTPQAWGWAQPQESWRIHTIAMWVRTYVICEGSTATSADKNSLHRFADQIGFTDAGLKQMGWAVSAPIEEPDDEDDEDGPDDGGEATPRRLRVV